MASRIEDLADQCWLEFGGVVGTKAWKRVHHEWYWMTKMRRAEGHESRWQSTVVVDGEHQKMGT
jgi:hypothetical protein